MANRGRNGRDRTGNGTREHTSRKKSTQIQTQTNYKDVAKAPNRHSESVLGKRSRVSEGDLDSDNNHSESVLGKRFRVSGTEGGETEGDLEESQKTEGDESEWEESQETEGDSGEAHEVEVILRHKWENDVSKNDY
jgi:hypothetical protein